MMATYQKLAGLVSKVRNARYGEMVKYLETLIDSGDWRDFNTPAGTRFQFRECEFDYFLLAMEVDPLVAQTRFPPRSARLRAGELASTRTRWPVSK